MFYLAIMSYFQEDPVVPFISEFCPPLPPHPHPIPSHFSFPVQKLIRVVEFSTAADLTKIKSGLLLRLRGYLKKIKMADLLIAACLSSGQMCGESKQSWINFTSHFKAVASDL